MPSTSDSDIALNSITMPSNDSFDIDYEVYVPLPHTFHISISDMPSDSIVLILIVLDPRTSDRGRRYPLRAR